MVSLASLDRAASVIAPSVGSSLKRKRLDSDVDSEKSSPVQTKKQRMVKFDPEVDVHILPDWNEKSQELVGEEVRRSLERHVPGDSAGYDQIKNLFTTKPTAADAPLTGLLQKYIIALTHNVASLTPKCSALVHAVIDCHWVARNERFMRSYRRLLQSLQAVQPGFSSTILQMLVNMFVELPSPAMRQQDDPAIQRATLQTRVHDCLKSLLRQDPMLSSHLSSTLPRSFPFPAESTKTHVNYIKNILKVTEYCPELKGEITALIMDRLAKIDMQILDEADDDFEDEILQGPETNEDEEQDADDSDADSDSSEESLNADERRQKELRENVNKLDTIMDILFEYYDSIFAKGDQFEIEEAFESLVSQFGSIILPTQGSRHVQFLLFHFAQYSPDFIEQFVGYCTYIAFDSRRASVQRVTAAAYLASFIARGAHVSKQVVRDAFDLLCHHLEIMRVNSESKCTGPDRRRYGAYYAVAQAIIYTFCFRWRDLIVTEDDEPVDEELIYQGHDFVWYKDVQNILRRNLFSKLNPLKLCAPEIVKEFAPIARHLHFAYIDHLIETNKRIRLSRSLAGRYLDGVAARETALTMKKGEDNFLLDAYFPFDPYNLPKSKRWVEKEYVVWQPIPGLESTDANGDADDDDESEDDEEEPDDCESESESQIKEEPVPVLTEADLEEETDGSA
jgi:RNA polymerase I-specific transcription initiation factor RRN3